MNLTQLLETQKGQIIPEAHKLLTRARLEHYAVSGAERNMLKVANGADEHLRVYILTPEQVKEWWSATPVGAATPKDGDLLWSGNAEDAGIWYIKVVNDNTFAVNLQMLLDIQERNVR